jgi:hypothetical protein
MGGKPSWMGDSILYCSRLSLSEAPSKIWRSSEWLLLFPASMCVFVFAKLLNPRGSVLFNRLLRESGLLTLGDKLLSLRDLLGRGEATLE